MSDLKKTDEDFQDKLKKIKVFLTDVDGVLTDGRVYWANNEIGFNRFFHISDGYGLKILMGGGLKVGVISGGESLGLIKRVKSLNLDFMKIGDEDKRQGYLEIVKECGVSDEEVLYMGDEFFDIPILRRVGFSACPPHAAMEVKAVCDYTTTRLCGEGCVREVVDMVRSAQNIIPLIPDF